MKEFTDTDAGKACHELALSVYEVTRPLLDTEPEIAHSLWLAALLAAAKLAHGIGSGSRVSLIEYVGISCGHLSEVMYHLDLAHAMGLIADDVHQRLGAMRGRASFYVGKHLEASIPELDSHDFERFEEEEREDWE